MHNIDLNHLDSVAPRRELNLCGSQCPLVLPARSGLDSVSFPTFNRFSFQGVPCQKQ